MRYLIIDQINYLKQMYARLLNRVNFILLNNLLYLIDPTYLFNDL